MATYKVIQDIEAEDKLLGPLTLRQFIYAIIVVFSGFVAFKLAVVAWWLAIPFLPHMILLSILASPFGGEQSSEIWLLAKIRFFLKPRKRIWDQSGIKELVTITVPKKIEKQLTDNLSQIEVRSRLTALANTIDSRGWAVKNVNVNLFNQPAYAMANDSDRLIDPSVLPREVPNYDTTAFDDILDEQTSPTAQHFTQLINASSQNHRQQIAAQMQQASAPASPINQPAPQPDYWFMNQPAVAPTVTPGYTTFDNTSLVQPGIPETAEVPVTEELSPAAEHELAEKLRTSRKKALPPGYNHMLTIQPLSAQRNNSQPTQSTVSPAQNSKVTNTDATEPSTSAPTPDPAILELASNDDLNVATIARQANKARQLSSDDEVVISLR